MKNKKKILIVEPHSDDSAIAAGAYLQKCSIECDLYFVLVSASSLNLRHKYVSKEERIVEYQNYVDSLNGRFIRPYSQAKNIQLPVDMESKLDLVSKADLVNAIEQSIIMIEPDEILVMGPSFHHDHTIVFECVKAATRPTFHQKIKQVLIMENPTYVHSWNMEYTPNVYFQANKKEIDLKLDRFEKMFPSQIRSKGNYLSREGILKWSKYRGIEARTEYAEAFHCLFRLI